MFHRVLPPALSIAVPRSLGQHPDSVGPESQLRDSWRFLDSVGGAAVVLSGGGGIILRSR
ncbi:hypothetical protein D3C87_2117250 [compost metagenome]